MMHPKSGNVGSGSQPWRVDAMLTGEGTGVVKVAAVMRTCV